MSSTIRQSAPTARFIGPISAQFERTTAIVDGREVEAVKVPQRAVMVDGYYTQGFPVRGHDMIRAGAPWWLLDASTVYSVVTEGRGRHQRVFYVYANPWRSARCDAVEAAQ